MSRTALKPDQPTDVLAIAGYGRSGSTILDRVLGHHQDVLAVGELVNVHHELWQSNHYCGCGLRGRACPFWEDVLRCWLDGRDEGAVDRFVALRKRWVGRTGLARAGKSDRAEQQEFLDETARLYRAVAGRSDAKLIVDSSKIPGWVEALQRNPGIDLKVVHLTRDGRAVVESLKRPLALDVAAGVQRDIGARSASHTSLSWVVGNVGAERVIRRNGLPSVRIAYESLLSDPMATLAAIGRLANVDLGDEATMVMNSQPFPRTHAVAGGRVRMSDEVVVDRRVRPARISRIDALTFWIVAGVMALRYGYRPEGTLGERD